MCARHWILQMFPPSGFIFPESPHPVFANRREKNGAEASIYHQRVGLPPSGPPPPLSGEDGSLRGGQENKEQRAEERAK